MAEIRIKKKSAPIWPWIIGLLILMAALWFFVEFALTEEGIRFESRMDENRQYQFEEVYPTHTQRIDQFIAMVNDDTFLEENVDEEKAKEGMQLLSDALEELIIERNIQNQEIIADQNALNRQVNGNTLSPNESGDINSSFYTAANLIEGIQQDQFPGMEHETSELKESALSIRPSQDLEGQDEQVKDFFVKSGQTLQMMRDGIYEEEQIPEVEQQFSEEVKLIKQIN
jgi:hypothetical protein